MYCPNCGYGNQDGAVRCRRCGQPLPTQRQSQNRYRRAEEPPHAPRPRRDYDDYDRQMRRTDRRDERSRRDERDERGGSGSSKTGTVILTILLILFLAAAIGAAAWYFFIREKSDRYRCASCIPDSRFSGRGYSGYPGRSGSDSAAADQRAADIL